MINKKIAYILKGFPRLSESFIANEVKLLREMGLSLELFSIKAGDELAMDENLPVPHYLPVVASVSNTRLITWLKENFSPYKSSQRYWICTAPLRYFSALLFALISARRYRGNGRGLIKKSFIKEFLFATYIAREIHIAEDIVHMHAHFCHDATTVAWIASKLTNIPFSFTAHAKDIYQEKLNPGNFLDRKIAAAQFAVTCTQANVKHLCEKTGCPASIHGIYHGLDIERFIPGSDDATKKIPQILSVGRMVEKKGFIYLVEACRILRDKGIQFTLQIVGESGDQTSLIEQKIEEHSLQDRIHLRSPMAQAELADVYRQANVFVLPCVIVADGDRDGIPNVMAEAMACGIPVVATEISGIPEIVTHGRNGLLVKPEDAASIADALEKLITSPQLRQTLGTAARQKILQVFDAKETHLRLKKLFLEVIDQQRGVSHA